MAHARCSASAAYRWTACAGSVREAAKYPNKESAAALEGTKAHEWAARCLVTGDDATDPALQMYVDYVRSRPGMMHIEVKLDKGLQILHPDLGGTADAVVIGYDAIEVIDLKYGKGIGVEAVGNLQLEIYALGTLLTFDSVRCKTVRVTIVQPRHEAMEPIRTWEFNAEDLIERALDIKAAAEKTRDPNAPLAAGDHCHFCPAAAQCPAILALRTEMVAQNFSVVVDPATVAKALAMIPALQAQIKAVNALAYEMASQGKPPPGYKLVEKRATRKWVVDAALPDAFYERSPMSPAQAEKVVGKKEFATYSALVTKQSSGYTLVEEGDKRPAATAARLEDFSVIEQDDLLTFTKE